MPIVACAARSRPRRAASAVPTIAVALVLALAACGPGPATSTPGATGPGASGASAGTPAATQAGAPGSACVTPAAPVSRDWNGRVWYEVFVRSFKDSNGDGIGDFKGLTSKLDYLKSLGIGGLWLMPMMPSPSYHGYDVTDYRNVEPDYGTLADFKAFLAAAHAHGIEVIIDLVLNHTSSDNPWFVDALAGGPHHDWYVWSKTALAWPSPTGGGNPWHQASNGQWYYGVFSAGMPDLNLRNADATAAVTDIARFWLHDVGVDGFRLDAARHLIEDGPNAQVNTPETLAWLAGFKESVHQAKPGALTVGEVWDLSSIAGSYVPKSLDLDFDFPLAAAVGTSLKVGDAGPLTTALGETIADWPANQEASFLTNHDQDRIMSVVFGDVPSAKLAAFTLLTEPGVPFLYYGEEVGLNGRKPDEQIRTPMPWTADGPAAGFTSGTPWEPLADDWQTANVATESADPGSLWSVYQSTIALRAAHPALSDGATLLVDGGAHPVIGWIRTTPKETLLAVLNVGAEAVDDYGLSLESGPLCGAVTASLVATVGGGKSITVASPDVTPAGGFAAYEPLLELAPRSGYLLSLTPAP